MMNGTGAKAKVTINVGHDKQPRRKTGPGSSLNRSTRPWPTPVSRPRRPRLEAPGERLYRTVLTHRSDRGHRPDAHLRRTAPAAGPGRVRGAHYNRRRPHRSRQLRPAQPDHPVADLSQKRSSADRPWRAHQRIRASRVEAQIKAIGRGLKPHKPPVRRRDAMAYCAGARPVRASSSARSPGGSAAPIRWNISSACRRRIWACVAWAAARAQRPRPASA